MTTRSSLDEIIETLCVLICETVEPA